MAADAHEPLTDAEAYDVWGPVEHQAPPPMDPDDAGALRTLAIEILCALQVAVPELGLDARRPFPLDSPDRVLSALQCAIDALTEYGIPNVRRMTNDR